MQTLALVLALLFPIPIPIQVQDDADQQFRAGRFDQAAESYAALVEANEEDAQAWYRLGYALHALGRLDEALPAHERAASFAGPSQSAAAYNAACASALLGKSEPALDWLERSIALGFGSAVQVERDADLASVRDHPRYRTLLAKLLRSDSFRYLRPLPPGSADQFDFWLGEWNTEVWTPTATNGWARSGDLTMKVERVAGGQALVEWADGSMGGGRTLGFSLRAYDPDLDAWTLLLNWPSPGSPTFSSLRGGFRHGRGEFVSPPGGQPGAIAQTRFSFSDTAADRLRWDGAATRDSGKTWNTNLLFEFTRRGADEAPLANGPSTSNSHAPGPGFRELDFLLGKWSGLREAGEAEHTVELEVTSVLEGSALTLERVVETGGERRESFAITAFDPGRGAWVAYTVTEGEPRFERREGQAAGAAILFSGQAGPGSSGARTRVSWTRDSDQLVCECTTEAGTVLWRERLSRRE